MVLLDKIEDFTASANSKTSFCSFKDLSNEELITFDYNFEAENNIPGASMDAASGIFTVGGSGLYQVNFTVFLFFISEFIRHRSMWK